MLWVLDHVGWGGEMEALAWGGGTGRGWLNRRDAGGIQVDGFGGCGLGWEVLCSGGHSMVRRSGQGVFRCS